MKKILSMIIALILLLVILSSCAKSEAITELTPEMEEEIKELYSNTYNFNKEDLTINFIGEFNGAYAVIVETGIDHYWPEKCEVVNGLDFVYVDTQPLHIIYDGNCYRLLAAYQSGLINDEDVNTLFQRCKPICSVTLKDNFANNKIIVGVMPSYNFEEYTTEDFAEIGCTKIDELFPQNKIKEGELCRYFVLTLSRNSKINVLRAIRSLEKRTDIYSANPDFAIYMN